MVSTYLLPMHTLPMQIELGEQLSQAGSLGSTSSLTNTLVGLLGGKPSLNGQALPQPSEAVLVGFIVAVAMSELSRAALAPLPDLGASGYRNRPARHDIACHHTAICARTYSYHTHPLKPGTMQAPFQVSRLAGRETAMYSLPLPQGAFYILKTLHPTTHAHC
jgi:hypothetical protein